MRRPIIAGNWKMNTTQSEAKTLIQKLIPLVKDAACDIVICPPACNLAMAGELIRTTNIKLGAQNVHWAAKGAFTGEISASMLKEMGVSYAIVGHSERRQYFNETDQTVNERAKAAIDAGIIPIICVGESLEERESAKTNAVVKRQTVAALKDIPAETAEALVIAYEPVWAIGTGRTATNEQADETIGVIRSVLASLYGEGTAEKVRIQYGGSMNAKNVDGLMSMPEIDGGLIGGASLKAEDFARIVNHNLSVSQD